jgi:hypothetical protein
MWVRSYLPERLWIRWVDGRLVVVAGGGHVAHLLGEGYLDAPPRGGSGVRRFLASLRAGSTPYVIGDRSLGVTRPPPPPPPAVGSGMGVEVYAARETVGGPVLYWAVLVHAAYLVLATAVVPAAWLARRRATRTRAAAGRCPDCGYDLRESPNGCPECGAGRAA